MKRLVFILFIFLPFISYSDAQIGSRKPSEKAQVEEVSSSGYLYRSKGHDGKEVSLYYSSESDEYTFKVRGKTYHHPRFRFKDILRRHIYDVPSGDWEELEKNIINHANIQKFHQPADEELITAALKVENVAKEILNPADGDCLSYSGAPSAIVLDYEVDEDTYKLNHKKYFELLKAEEDFVPMGKLLGMKLELKSNNDNPLHGMLGSQGAGLTTYGKGIEGDDRGKTFGIGSEVSLQFEKGEVALRQFSDGYGRLVSIPGRKYQLGDKELESRIEYDEKGRRFQEFLVIEGIELEVKRDTGVSDTYVKVTGRYKEMDDESGAAQSIQNSWHETSNSLTEGKTILYNYRDWMDKKTGGEFYFELGKNINVYSDKDVDINSEAYLSGNMSSLGNTERYYSFGGDIQAVFKREDQNSKFPSWSARAYAVSKRYADGMNGNVTGLTLTKYFETTENSAVKIEAGMSYEDDRYNTIFGQEEIGRNGRLDFQHQLNLGWEYKFN